MSDVRRMPRVIAMITIGLMVAASAEVSSAASKTTQRKRPKTTRKAVETAAKNTATPPSTSASPPPTFAGPSLAAIAAQADSEYPVPPDLKEEPAGTLIRAEAANLLPASPSWRVLYHSRSLAGRDIAVSGLAFVPSGTPPAGGWPVVTYAHGTVGLADRCAPSKKPSLLELAAYASTVARGYAIVATDYEGLGTAGRHPYLVGASEGRGVLDIARAARAIPGANIGSKVAIYGYSQGGHAALFAGELAPTWAPDLTIVGTVAGAPPSRFMLDGSGLATSPYRGYVLMVTGGQLAARPDLPVDAVLTPAGQAMLPVVDRGCTDEVFRTVNAVPLESVFKTGGADFGPWREALDATEPGRRIASPVLIVHGDKDEQVPFETSATLLGKLCARGTVVERKAYPGQNHTGGAIASLGDVTNWIVDRFAGKQPPKSCP